MIETKTVLILGAGASVPYGFPTGAELRREILRKIANQDNLQRFHDLGYRDIEELKKFREDFKASLKPSIDAFLESRPDYLELGKLVIAAFLVIKEDKDKLHPEDYRWVSDAQDGKPEPIDHWYQYLFQRMGLNPEQFEDSLENISVITFNYDRSLEYYLFETLKSAYRLGEKEAARLVNKFQIIHVYGLLGNTDFSGRGSDRRDYEPHQTPVSIEKAASMISLAGDRVEYEITDELELDQLSEARMLIERDQRIKLLQRTIGQAYRMIEQANQMAKQDQRLKQAQQKLEETQRVIEETQQKIEEVQGLEQTQIRIEEAQRLEQAQKFDKAKKLIEQAERICFIGFGYDKTNLERLGFPGILKKRRLFGTGYRLEEDVRRRAERLLKVPDSRLVSGYDKIGNEHTRTLQFLKSNLVFD